MLLLSGCALTSTLTHQTETRTVKLQGSVHGGQQPVAGASVYVYAASTTGYHGASRSLLQPGPGVLNDGTNNYVATDANGGFALTGEYTCNLGDEIYLLALGGDSGGGTNSSIGLMAVLGACPGNGVDFSAQDPFVSVNEVSTVGAAYAFAGFATDSKHVGAPAGTLPQTGLANAFAAAANLVDLPSGNALASTPAGNGTAPTATVYTLANILASCVNSNDITPGVTPSTSCQTLLGLATSDGTNAGTVPADTATAAINIAHHPGANVMSLFGTIPATPAFGGGLATQPNDFTLSVTYTGGGINNLQNLAIDAQGNVWATDNGPVSVGYVDEVSNLGATLSPPGGFPSSYYTAPYGIAIDTTGSVWVTNVNGNNPLIQFASNGTSTSLTDGSSYSAAYAISIDSAGNLLIPSSNQKLIYRFDTGGNPLTNYTTSYFMDGLAPDGNGEIWVTNDSSTSMSEFDAATGTPVSTSITGSAPFAGPVAIGAAGTIWTLNGNGALGVLDSTGAPLFSSSAGANGNHFAIDGAGSAWIATNAMQGMGATTYGLANVSSSGTLLSGSGYLALSAPSLTDIAIDGSGNVWLATGNVLTEVIGVASPTITPLAASIAANTPGSLPSALSSSIHRNLKTAAKRK
jgi:streptogramin lyase